MSKEIENKTPYEILGDKGIKDLANAFYEAMEELPLAADIKAMHSDNLDHVKRMLAAYLTGWMGGPPVYLAIKGTVCLTEPHEPFRIGPKERDQWLACMDAALDKIKASDGLKKCSKNLCLGLQKRSGTATTPLQKIKVLVLLQSASSALRVKNYFRHL